MARWYPVGGGKSFPSVTTVTSWAGYAPDYEGTRGGYKIPRGVLERASWRGTVAHHWASESLRGVPPGEIRMPAVVGEQMAGAIRSFDGWRGLVSPVALLIEHRVVSWRWGYAGRFDALVVLRAVSADLVLVDFKSRPLKDDDGVQLAAYQLALAEMARRGEVPNLSYPQAMSAKRLGVWLRTDGKTAQHRYYNDPVDEVRFLDSVQRFHAAHPQPTEEER